MAMADNKKMQTCLNLLHQRVTQPVVQANAVAALIRQAIIDNNLQDRLSAAERTALQNFVTDLAALASSSVVEALKNRYAGTHRNQALIIAGVND